MFPEPIWEIEDLPDLQALSTQSPRYLEASPKFARCPVTINASCDSQRCVARKAPGPRVIEPADGSWHACCIVSQGVEHSAGGNAESGGIAGGVEKVKCEQGDE
jgi:hypothetical protein